MLDKEKLYYLNQKQRYEDMYDIFLQEYKEIIGKFLEFNNIEYVKGGSILYYLEMLERNFGKQYPDVCKVISETFSSGRKNDDFSLAMAIDSYNFVKQKLKVEYQQY